MSNYKLLSPDDMSVEIADMENTDYGVGCKTNSRSTGPPIVCEADLAISTTFFSTFPKQVYVVELNATNSQDAAGECFMTPMALTILQEVKTQKINEDLYSEQTSFQKFYLNLLSFLESTF